MKACYQRPCHLTCAHQTFLCISLASAQSRVGFRRTPQSSTCQPKKKLSTYCAHSGTLNQLPKDRTSSGLVWTIGLLCFHRETRYPEASSRAFCTISISANRNTQRIFVQSCRGYGYGRQRPLNIGWFQDTASPLW